MATQKNQRALVVVSQLTNGIPSDMRWLYRFIEDSGRAVAESVLKDDSADYVTLYDQSATKANMLATLQTLGAKPTIKAIDLLVMLHGADNELEFSDGSHSTVTLANDLRSLRLARKLRLVYSTACYGASHADDFTRGGFSAAIGAKGVNANASVEFATLLQLWSWDWRLRDALASAETPLTRVPADEAARAFAQQNGASWAARINSDKTLRGNADLKISSPG